MAEETETWTWFDAIPAMEKSRQMKHQNGTKQMIEKKQRNEKKHQIESLKNRQLTILICLFQQPTQIQIL